jgi:hypothetical protein
MTVPMPSLAEFDNYVIYVGYDPQGATAQQSEKKKPAPKRARSAAPKADQ